MRQIASIKFVADCFTWHYAWISRDYRRVYKGLCEKGGGISEDIQRIFSSGNEPSHRHPEKGMLTYLDKTESSAGIL